MDLFPIRLLLSLEEISPHQRQDPDAVEAILMENRGVMHYMEIACQVSVDNLVRSMLFVHPERPVLVGISRKCSGIIIL